jgi:hypothetical protein
LIIFDKSTEFAGGLSGGAAPAAGGAAEPVAPAAPATNILTHDAQSSDEEEHTCDECGAMCNLEEMEYGYCENCFETLFTRWLVENNYEDGRWQDGPNTRVESDFYEYCDAQSAAEEAPAGNRPCLKNSRHDD